MAEEKSKWGYWKYIVDIAEWFNGVFKQPEGSNVGMVAYGICDFAVLFAVLSLLDYFLFKDSDYLITNLVISVFLSLLSVYAGVKAREEAK